MRELTINEMSQVSGGFGPACLAWAAGAAAGAAVVSAGIAIYGLFGDNEAPPQDPINNTFRFGDFVLECGAIFPHVTLVYGVPTDGHCDPASGHP